MSQPSSLERAIVLANRTIQTLIKAVFEREPHADIKRVRAALIELNPLLEKDEMFNQFYPLLYDIEVLNRAMINMEDISATREKEMPKLL